MPQNSNARKPDSDETTRRRLPVEMPAEFVASMAEARTARRRIGLG